MSTLEMLKKSQWSGEKFIRTSGTNLFFYGSGRFTVFDDIMQIPMLRLSSNTKSKYQ